MQFKLHRRLNKKMRQCFHPHEATYNIIDKQWVGLLYFNFFLFQNTHCTARKNVMELFTFPEFWNKGMHKKSVHTYQYCQKNFLLHYSFVFLLFQFYLKKTKILNFSMFHFLHVILLVITQICNEHLGIQMKLIDESQCKNLLLIIQYILFRQKLIAHSLFLLNGC